MELFRFDVGASWDFPQHQPYTANWFPTRIVISMSIIVISMSIIVISMSITAAELIPDPYSHIHEYYSSWADSRPV